MTRGVPAAPAPGGFPARRAGADRLAHRLRARRVRRVHDPRRRRDRARLPDARGAGERLPRGHDRRPVGLERAGRAAAGVPRAQRAAVRLLHARHADGGAGSGAHAQPKPPAKRSAAHISGNYCRCTGYQAIVDAIEEVIARGAAWVKPSFRSTPRERRSTSGYIGESVPRPNAQRLLQGRGAFIDDLRFPRLAHVVFFRSPYAHARIKKLDSRSAARAARRDRACFDGRAVAEYCTPWVAVLAHLKGIKSPPQHAIAIERACWQGEAVAAVVAETRAQAEDAVQHVEAEWEELPVVIDMEESLAGTQRHPPGARRQHLLQARARHRRRRRRVREGRRGGRGDLRLRPPHRRLPRGPRHPRRLQRRRALAHRVPLDAGAAHDAGHLLAPPRHPRRRTCA